MASKLLSKIRTMLIFFIVALVLSGITAFPLYSELQFAANHGFMNPDTMTGRWLGKVWNAVRATNEQYAMLFYGFDWLAFAHLVIATAFIGPYKDPVRNKWVIQWAMIACVGVIPLALIAGPIRGIPWFHLVIDCLFGVLGLIPLLLIQRWINQLEALGNNINLSRSTPGGD